MDTDQILDENISFEFKEQRMKQEGILWEGRPTFSPLFSWKKIGENILNRDGPGNIMIFLFGVWFLYKSFFFFIYFWLAIFTIAAMVIGFILLRRYLRRSYMRFRVSKSLIYFQIWRLGRTKRYIIDWLDIDRLSYVAYEDGIGTLYFISGKPLDVETYDFDSGERRFHPTFEMIPEVEKVWEQFQEVCRERKKSVAFAPPVLTK